MCCGGSLSHTRPPECQLHIAPIFLLTLLIKTCFREICISRPTSADGPLLHQLKQQIANSSMVFRIKITGKEKDVVVDIEDAIRDLGMSKLIKDGDVKKSAKRPRASSDSNQAHRPSPYIPRTPVSP